MNPRNCGDCGAGTGEFHKSGCDVERCARCGRQRIACDCVYEVNAIEVETLEQTHPKIYAEGAPEVWYKVLDAEIEQLGGRIRWTGVWPGEEECIEYGWYSRMVPGRGWVACESDHPDASPDLNRLAVEAKWDQKQRRYVRRADF